jgi:hypothetical protein
MSDKHILLLFTKHDLNKQADVMGINSRNLSLQISNKSLSLVNKLLSKILLLLAH